ncbi:hypothetical protein HOP61_13330 [Halomonas daqingensis]|uniref:Uncharacterized protein n=1 Tax=Billgrantia desiderata TaxID=52021 RepID=A0AAW4YVK7_9GAMM|nr:hypothetical protein [Halomonas desiderata]MCE8052287.1 hypothetical protein [Halomonas desiderata]
MGARGPKSEADKTLSVVTTTAFDRLQPPKGMAKAEKKIFQEIVNSVPPHWFNASHVPLMVQLVGHISASQKIAQHIAKLDIDDISNLQIYDRLLKMHDRETRAITSLYTKMRLSQQSTYTPKAGATAKNSHGNSISKKPWE